MEYIEKKIIHPVIIRANVVALFCFVLFISTKGLKLYFEHFVLEAENQSEHILTVMPAFKLEEIQFKSDSNFESVSFNSSILNNKKSVVHFWATWCAPCVVELPRLLEHAKANPELLYVLIASGDELQKIIHFLKPLQQRQLIGNNIRVLFDDSMKVAKQFGTFKLPETYYFFESGRLKSKIQGESFF